MRYPKNKEIIDSTPYKGRLKKEGMDETTDDYIKVTYYIETASKKSKNPAVAICGILWRDGAMPARDIVDKLCTNTRYSEASVRKWLNLLAKRGAIYKDPKGIYYPIKLQTLRYFMGIVNRLIKKGMIKKWDGEMPNEWFLGGVIDL